VAGRLAVEPVAGHGADPDEAQLGLPELGDGVLAARSLRQRGGGETDQLLEIETREEGDRAHSVAVQPEAEVAFARGLAVGGLARAMRYSAAPFATLEGSVGNRANSRTSPSQKARTARPFAKKRNSARSAPRSPCTPATGSRTWRRSMPTSTWNASGPPPMRM